MVKVAVDLESIPRFLDTKQEYLSIAFTNLCTPQGNLELPIHILARLWEETGEHVKLNTE